MSIWLQRWRKKWLRKFGIENFWYLTRIESLQSILSIGILPKNEVERFGFSHNSFAEETVQIRRHSKIIVLCNFSKKHIHDLVPVYLCVKTPTQYARKEIQDRMALIRINSDAILDDKVQFAFSDGNAASTATSIYGNLSDLDKLPWNVIRNPYWINYDDGKRKKCSEFLIFPKIQPTHFQEIGVSSSASRSYAISITTKLGVHLPVNKRDDWFF